MRAVNIRSKTYQKIFENGYEIVRDLQVRKEPR